MDAAKSSVKKFMSNTDKHDTTVHERVAPSVTKEEVAQNQHENVTQAVNKEVHQDHYHTSVQPVHHSETLAEQHHHRSVPVEHRSYEHDNSDDVNRRLAEERAQFKDEKRHVDGEHTTSTNPTVVGEHRHHHVHENIQPVVHKQTVEPHVYHTTALAQETHHNATQHHAGSTLPAMSMSDFQKQGGSLSGREERTDRFAGEPRSDGGIQDSQYGEDRPKDSHNSTSLLDNTTRDRRGVDDDNYGRNDAKAAAAAAGGYQNSSRLDPGRSGPNDGHSFGTMEDSAATQKKPSLMDKLNPSKDSNGDGKAGFMK